MYINYLTTECINDDLIPGKSTLQASALVARPFPASRFLRARVPYLSLCYGRFIYNKPTAPKLYTGILANLSFHTNMANTYVLPSEHLRGIISYMYGQRE